MYQMVVKGRTKFDIRTKFQALHAVDIYVPPGIFVASIPYKATIFTWFNEIALWICVHIWYKANNPLWKGKDKGIFVFFIHSFHYFLDVHYNSEMVSVVQKRKKVFM